MSNPVEEALIAAIKAALANAPEVPDGATVLVTASNPSIGVDLDAVPVTV